jgi:hypothetical protein
MRNSIRVKSRIRIRVKNVWDPHRQNRDPDRKSLPAQKRKWLPGEVVEDEVLLQVRHQLHQGLSSPHHIRGSDLHQVLFNEKPFNEKDKSHHLKMISRGIHRYLLILHLFGLIPPHFAFILAF